VVVFIDGNAPGDFDQQRSYPASTRETRSCVRQGRKTLRQEAITWGPGLRTDFLFFGNHLGTIQQQHNQAPNLFFDQTEVFVIRRHLIIEELPTADATTADAIPPHSQPPAIDLRPFWKKKEDQNHYDFEIII
jgi:hypothetical protein